MKTKWIMAAFLLTAAFAGCTSERKTDEIVDSGIVQTDNLEVDSSTLDTTLTPMDTTGNDSGDTPGTNP